MSLVAHPSPASDPGQTAASQPPPSRRYLSFTPGARNDGIAGLQVLETRGREQPMRLAMAPRHSSGVIDVRGDIVPIVDLRVRFGLECRSGEREAAALIVNVASRTVGGVVDADSVAGLGVLRQGPPQSLLNLLDIETSMTAPDTGLSETAHH